METITASQVHTFISASSPGTYKAVQLFHLTRKELQSGELILPGNWGSIIQATGQSHHCWHRENILETIRSAEFQNKPSRFNAVFAFIDPFAAMWWRQHERNGALLYFVEVADPTATNHIGDMLGVQMINGVDASTEAAARRYWSAGAPTFTTPDNVVIKEFFSLSSLRVIGRMEMP